MALAAWADALLDTIAGQVQVQVQVQVQAQSARMAGVADGQFVVFKNQPEAIDALMVGKIDAFAATALGSRAAAAGEPRHGGGRALCEQLPITDGRALTLTRDTQPAAQHRMLLDQLWLQLPAQPPPRISAAQIKVRAAAQTSAVVETFGSWLKDISDSAELGLSG